VKPGDYVTSCSSSGISLKKTIKVSLKWQMCMKSELFSFRILKVFLPSLLAYTEWLTFMQSNKSIICSMGQSTITL